MKDLTGFIALDEKGNLGVITHVDEMNRSYLGFRIDDYTRDNYTAKFKYPWESKKPHVVDSINGLKAKAENSLIAFGKDGKDVV